MKNCPRHGTCEKTESNINSSHGVELCAHSQQQRCHTICSVPNRGSFFSDILILSGGVGGGYYHAELFTVNLMIVDDMRFCRQT